jgi:hypothetical protein
MALPLVSVWVRRLLGLLVIAAIGFGIWYYYSGRIGGESPYAGEGGSSYANRAMEIIHTASSDTDQLASGADADLSACEARDFAACERAIGHFNDVAARLDKARNDLSGLNPPTEAQSWHRDYLNLLSDNSSLCRRAVSAWAADDWGAFSSLSREFEALDSRENQLVDYSNKNLR